MRGFHVRSVQREQFYKITKLRFWSSNRN